jgi:hypothetical protein
MTVSLKPSGFFDQNPALDVPQSTQKSNGSRLVKDKALVAAVGEQSCHKLETLVYERGLTKLEFRKTLKSKYIQSEFQTL